MMRAHQCYFGKRQVPGRVPHSFVIQLPLSEHAEPLGLMGEVKPKSVPTIGSCLIKRP